MEGLENFIFSIEDFSNQKASKKIDFFIYFLQVEKEIVGVTPKEIEDCFNTLHITPYSNIPAYLSRQSKIKNKKFLKKGSKYYLERSYRKELEQNFGNIILPNPDESKFLPLGLFKETRGYIERIAEQTINCYDLGLYDACSVLSRKLIEILIIETFEKYGVEESIKNSEGNFYFLSDLITELLKEPDWNLSRNTKKALPEIKKIGDLSAHNRRYFSRQHDIDRVRDSFRIVVEELIHLIDFKK
ncbi:hypothetical protein [Autumnicola edwardsiae]|uniref:DUF4145 domain-containing protein n=1 Tax=Autumnicola edwardsiae TaxID=3075594 RepID=A0ABU3CYV7_9FLAO|nr:hypothetical protein [Zunongwangia sp. F297]MDT0651561.1 hypothetical protein [Zunongwangia sp. F297]